LLIDCAERLAACEYLLFAILFQSSDINACARGCRLHGILQNLSLTKNTTDTLQTCNSGTCY